VTYGLHQRIAFIRSSAVTLPERDDFMKLTVTKGLRGAQGGGATTNQVQAKVRIPSIGSMFQIESIETTIARNKADEPEQLVILATSVDISTRELAKALEMRLLPKRPMSDLEKAAEGRQTSDVDESQTDEASDENSEEEDS